MKAPDWIAVDWGTTNLRVWGMSCDGTMLCAASSAKGMSKLEPCGFEPALLELIGGWLPESRATLIIACGMVGARQGWVEVAYQPVPCVPLAAARIVYAETRDTRLKVAIVPGVSQTNPHADVMRGEETQIAGFLSDNPAFNGVVCLPGTHTKWARIRAGEILQFQTFMTGELFELLRGHSVLRHNLDSSSWDDDEFKGEVSAAFASPETLAARLFRIRAESLLSGLEAPAANARLSGLLIGAELAAARGFWRGQQVAIIGGERQAEIYANGLGALGQKCVAVDGTHVTLAGLRWAYLKILEHAGDA
ncbi:MAG: 2-dehydro-3-deoxygalactonokinase [Methylobacteriaceae bacterium]|nr:2-dehydro-3-deoxygalactonokinase [Methylobacteriaceae bacterium]